MRWISILFLLGSCATEYPECYGDEVCIDEMQRYDLEEYIETEFKPFLAACTSAGGYVYYSGGMMSRYMRHALDTGDYSMVKRIDLVGFSCAGAGY